MFVDPQVLFYVANWFILVGVFMMALLSPGPDFVVAVRQSVMYGRRAGVMSAVGFSLGVAVHVTYCLFGIAALIAQSLLLFSAFKYLGALYLFYVGICALRSKGFKFEDMNEAGSTASMGDIKALRVGFITNLFNPKATLFFLALFTQILSPDIPAGMLAFYGFTCVVMTGVWFSVVAMILTIPTVRKKFVAVSQWIDRMCGGALIALSVRLALAKATPS